MIKLYAASVFAAAMSVSMSSFAHHVPGHSLTPSGAPVGSNHEARAQGRSYDHEHIKAEHKAMKAELEAHKAEHQEMREVHRAKHEQWRQQKEGEKPARGDRHEKSKGHQEHPLKQG